MKWLSTHGTGESDVYQCDEWELVRKVLGFDIERVVIIHKGEKVMQIEAQDGLRKAMEYCASVRMKSPAFFGEP